MAKHLTSRDVAARAGVSQSTVSYVLSGKRPISPEVRQKVLDAMAELDYQPDSGARSLRSRQSRVVGLDYPLAENRWVGQLAFLQAVTAAWRAHDYDTLFVMSEASPSELRRVAGTRLCDAIMIFEVTDVDPRVEAAASLGVPALLLGVPENRDGVVCVDIDSVAAGRQAVDVLAGAGYRRIVALQDATSYAQRLSYERRFQQGIAERAAELGLALTSHAVQEGFHDHYATVERVLAAGGDPGLVVSSQLSVDAVLNAVALQGRTPGVDVSLITYGSADDVPVVQGRRMAAIDNRRVETLELAVRRTLEMITGDPACLRPGQCELLEPRYVPGDTVRPAPAGD
jgi:DNA-binding LacI/PurR family transcriptional regulator